MEQTLHWYGVKIFFNKVQPIARALDEDAVQYYTQAYFPSLIFIRCDSLYIENFRTCHWQQAMVYCDRATKKTVIVDDRQMETFILVTSAADKGLEFLGDDLPEYHLGDKVRVTDGPFKGAEGHIKRIRRDRRLIISINGVAAVATSYIHPRLLEKI